MRINLDQLRYDLLKQAGLPVPDLKVPTWSCNDKTPYVGTVKLPSTFHTAKPVDWYDDRNSLWREVMVFTTNQVKAVGHTHRIMIKCEGCNKWMFAGKLLQHQKSHKKEV